MGPRHDVGRGLHRSAVSGEGSHGAVAEQRQRVDDRDLDGYQ
ncbi:hypothetical protein AB0F95_22485 [Micromonospora tulbaghiae]